MNDSKRRVLPSTAVSKNDTPTRGIAAVRASPTVSIGGNGPARVRTINNNVSEGANGSGSNVATPTARNTPLTSASARQATGNALSPAASAAVRARARVLGYDQQEASTSSPLASSSRFNGPSTPSSSVYSGPATPGSSYNPSSVSSSSITPSTSAARAQASINGSASGASRPTPTSHLSSSSVTRKVRAASTPPFDDSPTVSRPVSPSKRRAFPAFASQASDTDSPQQRSSSPSTSLGQPKIPRVRPISGVRSNTAGTAGLLSSSRAGADPVKPPLYHSKSMTSRPPSAAPSALLPSPTIRASPSTVFPSSSSAISAPIARVRPTAALGSGQSPSPSTSTSTSRPLSPVRMRPPSPVRPASPRRGEAFRPVSALSATSPRQLDSSTFHKPISASFSPPIVADIASNAKRPSTSSQSSSTHSIATTADTSSSTTTTAATSFTSPDPKILSDLSTSPASNIRNSSSSGMNGYHRARRRSQSTSSSLSSTSNRSSNISKTKVLSSTSTSATTTRHSRTGSASTHASVGIGISIPQVTSPAASAANLALSTSPIMRGSLSSPQRQTPLSPGKGFFSEAEKMEQQAHLDAKVHRKILDLEITNTSLLAINASLEKAKAKQSAELRELRRRMRDRTSFAPLSSSPASLLSPSSAAGGGDFIWNEHDEEEEKEMSWEEILKEDEKFADMVRLLDSMTRRGKEALEKVATGHVHTGKSGPKVLNHFDIPEDPSIQPEGKTSAKKGNHSLAGLTATTRTSTTDGSTIEPDSEEDDDDDDDETTDQSEANTSNATESQNESSEALSSFEVSRGMNSNSEFSISID